MAAWPNGITLITARWGKGYTTLAENVSATLLLETIFGTGNEYVVWSATGDPWLPFPVSQSVPSDAVGTVQVPAVDQDGWIDPRGNIIKNWHYRATISYTSGNQNVKIVRNFYPLVGSGPLDLDMIPDAGESAPIVVLQSPVRTVNGVGPDETGNVPLTISKSIVGLANVDNTSDVNKPVSTAQSNAIGAKYTKPGTGIPSSDLATAVVTSLGRADTAVQPAGLTKAAIGLGNVDNTSDANKPLSTAASTALAAKADLVGGVIPTSQMPALALTAVVTVASQAAMLALTTAQVQPGDIAIRTDGAGSFILTATDPTVLGNWTLLSSAAGGVTSVNSQTGTVVLAKSDLGLGNVDNTSDANKPISSATSTALGLKANATALTTKADLSSGFVPITQVTPGTTITVMKAGSTWPARPTSRTDVIVQWKGADPSPAIVTSGTGGMMDGVDVRLVVSA